MTFIRELQRRNVFRVAGLYLVGAWLVVQVASTVLPAFEVPAWALRALIVLLAIGFPLALVLSWAFELTPAGLRRDDGELAAAASAPTAARRMDRLLLAVLVAAVAYFAIDKFLLAPRQVVVAGQSSLDRGGDRAISPQSIAVLPFTNMSGDADAEPFVDGMHDDLLTQLARIGALKVISRTSVQEYRNTRKNLRQVAAELGVATILEGGVQRAGNRLRINAQLIDARTDQHLWAQTYDRELNAAAVFELQSELARSIADALKATLLPAEALAIDRQLTTDLNAWMAYRTALHLVNRADTGDFDAATEKVDFALARDPMFSAAWALRSRIAIGRYWFSDPSESRLRASREALDRGLAIDPASPELQLAEGYYWYWGHRDYARALAATDAALRAIPNDADLHRLRGFILRRAGEWESSIAAQQRALDLDPRNALGHAELALTFIKLGELARAQTHVDAALTFDPMWGWARMANAILLVERDRALAPALVQLTLPDLGNTEPAYRRWWLLAASGDFAQALAEADFGRHSGDRKALWPPATLRGLALRYAGREAEAVVELAAARTMIEERLRHAPDFGPAVGALCLTLGAMRERAAALPVCRRLLEFGAADAMQTDEIRYLAASGLALAGATAEALPIIEATLAGPRYNGVAHFELDPAFATLRSEPGFVAIMQRHRSDADVARVAARP